jgi:KaiC/GvpD/RAD55 family RecA-like ATPase
MAVQLPSQHPQFKPWRTTRTIVNAGLNSKSIFMSDSNSSQHAARLSTGIEGLDDLLGGGLIPGTLTAVVGATGIGKTQFGLQFVQAGLDQEGRRGIIFDMCSRGDSQNHAAYAQRMFNWQLSAIDPEKHLELDHFFQGQCPRGDYLHIFHQHGRRVTRADLEFEAWHDWQAELARRLSASIAFFYGNFVEGVRRAVIDGIEPVDRPSDSIQFELFEYIYHQILRKDPEWVARDLFREKYRANAETIAQHVYDPANIGCLLLCTSRESSLDALIERQLDEGDVLSNANTIISMGKIREGAKFLRAMYVVKHRGSACTDEIIPYHIEDGGIRLGW